jgi:hypothetical protein
LLDKDLDTRLLLFARCSPVERVRFLGGLKHSEDFLKLSAFETRRVQEKLCVYRVAGMVLGSEVGYAVRGCNSKGCKRNCVGL